MDISLIIPAYNEEKYIGACLDAALTHSRGRFKEIIVVDNASVDRTGAIAREYEGRGVRVVREDRKGLTHARQAGLEASNSEWVAYIDADCLIHSNWLSAALGHISKRPEAIALSGPVKYHDGPHALRRVIEIVQFIILPATSVTTGFLILGGNFIARRDAIAAIGGFDRAISFYGEDADLGRRLSKHGVCLFRNDFFIFTSARRLLADGIVRTLFTYMANYISVVARRKPLTARYTDARL
ncbi:MAG: family 2 glycosyl transferase [Parcubacteria group bacterium GW2011_GWA2_51_10]|nr:MAG: family 2 glycosyl transferase [Parcubacteria group bacterium GW2011_GWA2_51_10]